MNLKPDFKRYISGYPFLFLSLVGIIQYSKILFRGKSVGWDSIDAIYPTFLYIVDCLTNFKFPFYNPLTVGGVSIGHNFFTAFLLNPIDISLALLGTVISPLYVFQFQFPIFAVLSGYWIFQYLKTINDDNTFLSLLGGMAYFTAILFPLAGQGPFFYSFVLFAFLLSPFRTLSSSPQKIYNIFSVVTLVSIMLKGYFFFIPFCLLAAFLLIRTKKIIILLAISSVSYMVLTLPILSFLKSSLGDLTGNFISPEPRLRSLVPEKILYNPNFLSVLGDLVDWHYLKGKAWSRGFNLSLVFLFFAQLCLLVRSGSRRILDYCLLFLMIFFMFMSNGSLSFIHQNLPILGSFRWGFSYSHFSQICYLFFICSRPFDWAALKKMDLIFISFFLIIMYLSLGILSLKLAVPVLILSAILILRPGWLLGTALLFTLAYTVIYSRRSSFIGGSPEGEYKLTHKRETKVHLERNLRDVGVHGDYLFEDRNWLYQKFPTLNGYNNSIHPIFWYLKAQNVAQKVVIPLCGDALFKIGERRSYNSNDNVYLGKLKDDIVAGIQNHRCTEEITHFFASPDEMRFTPKSQYTIILQNVEHFTTVTPVIRERNLPGGIRILESEPGKTIELRYKVSTIATNLVYLILSFIFILWALISAIRMRCAASQTSALL
ncbi:MAG TPA: hypothetical protein VNJ08_02780 [Bacteriovoracaceae bacterium]|nr:hypothetical protein [Bacteriovoracaceae bacterium]